MCEFRAKTNLETLLKYPYHYEYRPGGHNWKCKKPLEDKVSFTVKYYEDTDDHRTETKNETLASSLLIHIKESNPAKKDLEEAFCWDVDPFNIAFEIDSVWRPSEDCKPIPSQFCAVVYDSRNCYSGWSMNITSGAQKKFNYFSSDWKYRNDIDTVGVKAGCTFTGFSGSSFDGTKMSISAVLVEKWVVLAKESEYLTMHENIESLQCICRG